MGNGNENTNRMTVKEAIDIVANLQYELKVKHAAESTFGNISSKDRDKYRKNFTALKIALKCMERQNWNDTIPFNDSLVFKSQLIASCYGLESCINQVMEKCGELIQAAAKWNRANSKSEIIYDIPVTKKEAMEHLIEELADVQAVIYNLAHLLGCSDKMFEIMEMKADRQISRVSESL